MDRLPRRNGGVLFTTGGKETVDAWLEFLLQPTHASTANEPTETKIGGQPATTITCATGAPFCSHAARWNAG